MNRRNALILALVSVVVLGGCATAGTDRPGTNRFTRDAEQELALAMLREDPQERAQHYERALAIAQEGLEQHPENASLWLLAGQASVGVGDYVAADTMFARAETLHPEFADEILVERENAWIMAYNEAAEALQQDRTQDAIQLFELADQVYPQRPDARVVLGWLYQREGETAQAISSYQAALDVLLGPLPEGMTEEHEAEWLDNMEAATFQLGQLLSVAGRHDEAVRTYERFLERRPEHIEAQLNLAIALTEAGRDEEANRIFARTLQADLTERQLFLVGVGLFQAQEYGRAADAFRQVLSANPYSRDGAYNLAQALFVTSGQLEERLDDATGAEAQRLRTELAGVLDEMREAAETARELDPYNRNILLLQARAYRGLADLAASEAERQQWQQRTVEALQRFEEIEFEVTDVNIASNADRIEVFGTVENVSLQEGAPIPLRFTLFGEGGRQLASEVVTITAPPAEQQASFELSFALDQEVTGWRYERAN